MLCFFKLFLIYLLSSGAKDLIRDTSNSGFPPSGIPSTINVGGSLELLGRGTRVSTLICGNFTVTSEETMQCTNYFSKHHIRSL